MNRFPENVTLAYVFVFCAGLLLGYAINWVVNKRRGAAAKRDGFLTVVGVVIIVAMGWIMVSTNQARNCALRLNNSLSVEQAIAKEERDAFAAAIAQSLSVDPAIAALPQSDPRRKAVFDPITSQYLASTDKARQERQANQGVADEARRACGTS